MPSLFYLRRRLQGHARKRKEAQVRASRRHASRAPASARRRPQPKTKHLLRQQPKSNLCSCSEAQKPRLRLKQQAKAQRSKLKRASSRSCGCQQTWHWTGPTVQRGLETQENSSREYCKTCKDRESAAANVKRASASANHQQPRGRAKNAANGAKDGIMASSCSSAAARKMAWTRRTRRS